MLEPVRTTTKFPSDQTAPDGDRGLKVQKFPTPSSILSTQLSGTTSVVAILVGIRGLVDVGAKDTKTADCADDE